MTVVKKKMGLSESKRHSRRSAGNDATGLSSPRKQSTLCSTGGKMPWVVAGHRGKHALKIPIPLENGSGHLRRWDML
jgi:hypothetical protein